MVRDGMNLIIHREGNTLYAATHADRLKYMIADNVEKFLAQRYSELFAAHVIRILSTDGNVCDIEVCEMGDVLRVIKTVTYG